MSLQLFSKYSGPMPYTFVKLCRWCYEIYLYQLSVYSTIQFGLIHVCCLHLKMEFCSCARRGGVSGVASFSSVLYYVVVFILF